MNEQFRKKIEGAIADGLIEKIHQAESATVALEILDRLRRFATADRSFEPRLIVALGGLRESKLLGTDERKAIDAEWRRRGGHLFEESAGPVDVTATAKDSGQDAEREAGSGKTRAPRIDKLEAYAMAGGRIETFNEMLFLPARRPDLSIETPWHEVVGSELAKMVKQLDPIDGRYAVDTVTTEMAWRSLPFYENAVLIRVADLTWISCNLIIFYLALEGDLFRLNGTSPPIHAVNSKAPIELGDDNVLEYLRFFTTFVRGDEGPFYAAESINDPLMPDFSDEKLRNKVASHFKVAEMVGTNEQGHFLCDVSVFYANAIFDANFAVQPSGMIEMLSDKPVMGDLAVKMEVPIA